MKYVDHIVRYLSGDLNAEENRAFEKQLAADPQLSEEYKEISAAFRLIRKGVLRKDTEAFREKLKQVMKENPSSGKRSRKHYLPAWYLILSVAASLALLLVILMVTRGKEQPFVRFYHPQDDHVLLALGHESRGNAAAGIALFKREEYAVSRLYLESLLEAEPDNNLALLYYLLSSIETGQEEDALQMILGRQIECTHPAGRAITWYSGLALLKLERPEAASGYFQQLADPPGSYSKEARALQKELFK